MSLYKTALAYLAGSALLSVLVSTTATAQNQAPEAFDQTVVINVNTDRQVLLDARDDGQGPDSLSADVVTGPQNGTVTREGNLRQRYRPNAGFSGVDTFTWRATDGEFVSNLATVTMIVNERPQGRDQEVFTYLDQPVTIRLDSSDDGLPGPHVYELVREPDKGSLSEVSFGRYRYTPNPGQLGADTFTWRLFDGALYTIPNPVVRIDIEPLPEIVVEAEDPTVNAFVSDAVAGGLFDITNDGGGILEWEITETKGPLFQNLSETTGTLMANESAAISFDGSLNGLRSGVYYSELTVVDRGGLSASRVLSVVMFLSSGNPNDGLGFGDLAEVFLVDVIAGGPAGTIEFERELDKTTLKVIVDEGVEQARLLLQYRTGFDGMEYLRYKMKAPVGTSYNVFLEAVDGEDTYRFDPLLESLRPGFETHHMVTGDFLGINDVDVATLDEVKYKFTLIPDGFIGQSGEEARTLYIEDLRLSRQSLTIEEAAEAGPVEIVTRADLPIGAMTRPWEGIVLYLLELYFTHTRMSAMGLDDWEGVDQMISGIGNYDFEPVDTKYKRVKNLVHFPWIPTVPFFLWQVRDPDIVIEGSPLNRPKYAFSPPINYEGWKRVVRDYVRYHSVGDFGVQGFSILNEPNGIASWAGTEEEAHEFFAQTADAVKEADSRMQVAGPNHAGFHPREIDAFLAFSAENDVPLDILAWHFYFRGRSPSRIADQAKLARMMLERYPGLEDTELVVNEWGYGLRPEFHFRSEGAIAGAAMAEAFKAFVDSDISMGLFYSLYPSLAPSVQVSGLFSYDQESARPSLYAMEMFNALEDTRVTAFSDQENLGVESIASVDESSGVVTVLVWWHITGNGEELAVKSVDFSVRGLDPGRYRVDRFDMPTETTPGRDYIPLAPNESVEVNGPRINLNFDIPLYGVSMVRLVPQ